MHVNPFPFNAHFYHPKFVRMQQKTDFLMIVAFVAELPRNVMGKVRKSLLRELYADSFAPEA